MTYRNLVTAILALGVFALVCIMTACTGPEGVQGQSIQGPVGSPGQNGQDGAIGPQGNQGAQGPAGLDANPITVVKLCNETPSYGVFVEFAMCINGSLYGVYSQNGGFLALLANGSYSSNGIGSACNLTVNGCVVSH